MESWSLDMREKPQDEKDRTLLSAQAKDNLRSSFSYVIKYPQKMSIFIRFTSDRYSL